MSSKSIFKNQLIYLIKHNAFVKNIYIIFGSIVLKILGLFIKTNSNLVLFVPNTGATFSGSPKEIYDHMKAHAQYEDLECIWAFNEPEKMSQVYGLKTVKLDSLSYFITSLKAKYWVTDINVERGLHYKKKETIFLNTWHGVALKKIGNDDSKSAKYDYSDIDFLCVSGGHDRQVFSTALNAIEENFLTGGMPRNDRLFKTQQADKIVLKRNLGIPENKKVLLYVPTWRDSKDKGKTYSLALEADFKTWEKELKDYVLLFRAHHRTTEVMNIEFNDFIRDYSNYPDINDLYIVSDALITDYSSVVFDFSILKRPVFCYAYDYEKYLKERGFYITPKEIFENNFYTEEEKLLERLKNLDVITDSLVSKSIFKRYMNESHGNATMNCVKELFGEHRL